MDNNSSVVAVANGSVGSTGGPLDGSNRSNLVTLWVSFLLVMLLAAAFDACYLSKKKGMKGSTSCPSYVKQIIFWIICGFGFSFMVVILIGWPAGGSWTYGYFLEYMLSVDNLFVFQLVFKSYATPDSHVERALFWGILAAILLRLVFFGVGTTILAMGFFSKLIFGLLLIYSGFKALWESDDDEDDPSKNLFVRCVAKLLPLHNEYSEDPRFFVRVGTEMPEPQLEPQPESGANIIGLSSAREEIDLRDMMDVEDPPHNSVPKAKTRCKVTPLFLVVLTLALIDVIFAVDSVTAKVSFFLNLSSSAFAMFVLRSLYLVVDMLTQSFRFLKYGVGIVLVFIGIKLIVSGWFEVSMMLSSMLILSFLLGSILLSCLPCCKEQEGEEELQPDEPSKTAVDEAGEVFVIEDDEELRTVDA